VTAEIAIVIRDAPHPHRLAERLRRLWSDRGRWPTVVEGALVVVPVPASLAQAARDEIDRILASE
jgi:hypothetical protein